MPALALTLLLTLSTVVPAPPPAAAQNPPAPDTGSSAVSPAALGSVFRPASP